MCACDLERRWLISLSHLRMTDFSFSTAPRPVCDIFYLMGLSIMYPGIVFNLVFIHVHRCRFLHFPAERALNTVQML